MPTKSKKKTRRATPRKVAKKPAKRRAKKTTFSSVERAAAAKIIALTKKLESAVHRAKVIATKKR